MNIIEMIAREIESDPRARELAASLPAEEFYASHEFAVIAETARNRAVLNAESAAREFAHELRTDRGAMDEFMLTVHAVANA